MHHLLQKLKVKERDDYTDERDSPAHIHVLILRSEMNVHHLYVGGM